MTSKEKKEPDDSDEQSKVDQSPMKKTPENPRRAKIRLVKDLESFADQIDQQIEYFLKL